MSPARLACLSCLIFQSAALVLAQPPTPPPPPPPSTSAKRTPAEELIDRSLEKLAKLPWLETTFKHQMQSKGPIYQAEGRHIVAPAERKVCFETRVNLGNFPGLLRIHSDGTTVWRTLENGSLKHVQRYALKDLDEAREKIESAKLGPDLCKQLLRDDDSEHGFLGVQPVMLELREKLTFPKLETSVLAGDKPVYVLEGEWTKAYLDKLAPSRKDPATGRDLREAWTKRTGFPRFPRSCKLYLGRENLWPYRIEWYGPAMPEGRDELLVSLDYAEPKLTRPGDEQQAKLFRPSEEELKIAEDMDASQLITTRQNSLLRLKAQEEKDALDRSQLDPTTVPKRP